MRRAWLLTLFFFTGATALGYQLVWTRMLANILGHEMRAVIAIVTGFMGGMALGAWWLGGVIRRSKYPGRWYAGLEIVIGICAVATWANILWLLIPAVIAMGASFPAMIRFMKGRDIAGFYAANTLGAVIGIVVTTWGLLPEFGLRISALILAAVNIWVGLSAWWLTGTAVDAGPSATADRRSLLTVLVTGLLAIGFEILGVRVLSQVMENTVYSFAATLAVYLLGTSLGAAWYQRFGRDHWLNNLLIGAAIVCLVSTFVMPEAQWIYSGLRSAFGDSLPGIAVAEMGLAAFVFLGPTIIMGAIFSLLMQRAPGAFSKMLAVNTFGSALAPVIFGVLLLPAIGSKWALIVASAAYFILVRPWRWGWVMSALGAVFISFFADFRFVKLPTGSAIVDYREGVMASVAVVRDLVGNRTLKVNNRFQMGGTSAVGTEQREAHLPLRLHPNPRRALFLGTGTGITFGAATQYPQLEADGVELLPEVVAVMHHFKPHNFLDAYDGRLHIHVADARRFIQTTQHRYDVIVADLFHPARDGAGTLYTREHFTAIRCRLNQGGIFCQWLPLHQMDETMLRVVIRTFMEVFPNATAYLLHWTVDVPVLGLMGSDQWVDRTVDPKISGGFVAAAEALRRFAGDAPINTDDHQIVTYAAPRFSYKQNATPYGRLMTLLELEPAPSEFLQARNVYLQGLVEETEGRLEKAINLYLASANISDDFTMGYSRCISLAAAQARDRPQKARELLELLVRAKPKEKLARDLLERLFPTAQK